MMGCGSSNVTAVQAVAATHTNTEVGVSLHQGTCSGNRVGLSGKRKAYVQSGCRAQ